ncbi:MAG: hypothetical protein WCK02_03935 [Bacteroidota bacterium]
MNSIYWVLLGVLLISPPKEVELIKATSQKWMGGRANSGNGMSYRIALKVNKSYRRLKFQKLWINNQEYNFSVLKKQDTASYPHYKKSDTVFVVAGYYDKFYNIDPSFSDSLNKTNLKTTAIPTGEAVIEYRIGRRKTRYLAIEKLEVLKTKVLP